MTDKAPDMECQTAITDPATEGAQTPTVVAAELIEIDEQHEGTPQSSVTTQPDKKEPSLSVEQSDDKPFPFMKLPLELRAEVYKQHLIMAGTIASIGRVYPHPHLRIHLRNYCGIHEPPHHEDQNIDLSVRRLWAVSKTIYYEAIPVFFRYNDFDFETLDLVLQFLSQIGPTSRRNISSMSFNYTGKAPAKAIRLLKECVGLRSLAIRISHDITSVIPFRAFSYTYDLMRVWGMKDLLKIRGIETLEIKQEPPQYPSTAYDAIHAKIPVFEAALQVLKQPHNPAHLTRQEKKDYPLKATRTVFGMANVKTRTEKKLIAAQAAVSD